MKREVVYVCEGGKVARKRCLCRDVAPQDQGRGSSKKPSNGRNQVSLTFSDDFESSDDSS